MGMAETTAGVEATRGRQGASLPSRGRRSVSHEPGQEPVPASTKDLAAQVGSSGKPSVSGVHGREPRGGSATLARKEGGPSVWPSQPSRGSRAWARGCRQGGHPWVEGSGCGCGSGLWGRPCARPRVRGRPQLWAGRRAGQCLRGFPGGRRRLLHRWHKEAPAWGCPGAGQPL